jgi:regulator of sigma E protease
MNFLFAVLVFGGVAAIWGVPIEPPPVIGGVSEELLPAGAEALGAVPRGTRITSVGGEPIEDWGDLRLQINMLSTEENVITFANADPVRVDIESSDSARAMLFFAIEPRAETPARLQEVVADGPAARAGLESGDVVVEANGQPVGSWQEFVEAIEANPDRSVSLVVERDDDRVATTVVPDANRLESGRVYGRIGVQGAVAQTGLPRERLQPLSAAAYGFTRTWDVVVLTVDFLGGMFTGRHSARSIGGPIEIGRISGQVARAGIEQFLNFMALFSVNLAVLNLLPIPVLDGGQLMFLLFEGVRGRPLSIEQRMRLTQVGFVMILLIMAWAIGNDVLRALGI